MGNILSCLKNGQDQSHDQDQSTYMQRRGEIAKMKRRKEQIERMTKFFKNIDLLVEDMLGSLFITENNPFVYENDIIASSTETLKHVHYNTGSYVIRNRKDFLDYVMRKLNEKEFVHDGFEYRFGYEDTGGNSGGNSIKIIVIKMLRPL